MSVLTEPVVLFPATTGFISTVGALMFAGAITALPLACTQSPGDGESPMSARELNDDLALLKTKRIFFGHQSVGTNILDGLRQLSAADSAGAPSIVRLEASTTLPPAFLAEKPIGENTRPDLKCADFRQTVEGQLQGKVDVALMKFCYVDITGETDVRSLFATYQSTIDSLKARHPEVTVVAATVPLTFKPTWWKQLAGRLLGRTTTSESGNIKRNMFNALVRERFAGQPLFDLAAVESTRPDGTVEGFDANGQHYAALVPEYSVDGGHLNDEGKRRVAEAFVKALAKAVRKTTSTP